MEKEDITFSTVLIQLLSGIVVKEAAPESWNTILSQQYRIQSHKPILCHRSHLYVDLTMHMNWRCTFHSRP